MNLARSLGSVGGLTLVSRVLALVRDTLQASYVGASFASDAFFVAFRLPNMFRALFAEGAFSAAFIPMFNRKVGEADDVNAGLLMRVFQPAADWVMQSAAMGALPTLRAATDPDARGGQYYGPDGLTQTCRQASISQASCNAPPTVTEIAWTRAVS